MPRCFQLTRRSDVNAGPVILQQVDDEMRIHFNQPPDADHWLGGWYESIGCRLACGHTFDQILAKFNGCLATAKSSAEFRYYTGLSSIARWLNDNFTADSFYQPKL